MTSAVAVRRATPDDLDGIVALQNEQNGEECEAPVRGLAAAGDVGIGAFTVAVDGDNVVSSLCIVPEQLSIDGVGFSAAQVEYVATYPAYGGRGLVRSQMELVHEWSAERGDLAQLIAGIRYFYRLFGYEYAIAMAQVRLLLPGREPEMPRGWTVRDATAADVDDIVRLQDDAQRNASIVARRPAELWSHRIDRASAGSVVVAEQAGTVGGIATIGGGPPGVGSGVAMLGALAADRRDAVSALVAAARERGKPVAVERRPGTIGDAVLAPMCATHPRDYAWYVRVGDPVAFLERLRPVLSARLANSPFASLSTRLLLSLYRSSIVLEIDRGEVMGVVAAGPEQDPAGKGGAGVPPDQIATLIFGRYGALGLSARQDDVELGAAAGVMEVLFPRLTADLMLR